jgi:hypothetical protein
MGVGDPVVVADATGFFECETDADVEGDPPVW